jgi:NAD(P)H-hydrate epimerase
MYEPLSDNNKGFLTKAGLPAVKKLIAGKSVLAIGPGLGTEDETSTIVSELVKKSAIPVVVDADGLNCLAKDLHGIGAGKAPIVFTPHIGEMARLAGLGNKQILDDRMGVARKFAKAQSVYLVLKGAKTIIATPDGNIYINPTGNPGMATAGMGDVLTGVIAGFIAQKLPILTAVIAGVYIHGLAGDMAAKDIGERGLLASDVINMLPKAISKLRFI